MIYRSLFGRNTTCAGLLPIEGALDAWTVSIRAKDTWVGANLPSLGHSGRWRRRTSRVCRRILRHSAHCEDRFQVPEDVETSQVKEMAMCSRCVKTIMWGNLVLARRSRVYHEQIRYLWRSQASAHNKYCYIALATIPIRCIANAYKERTGSEIIPEAKTRTNPLPEI